MKLFKSLLIAPATLGLLAPMSANATEINLNEISSYSDIETVEFEDSFSFDNSNENSLLAGGEGLVEDHSHDGSFSKQQLLLSVQTSFLDQQILMMDHQLLVILMIQSWLVTDSRLI